MIKAEVGYVVSPFLNALLIVTIMIELPGSVDCRKLETVTM